MFNMMMLVTMLALFLASAEAAEKCKELKQFLAVGDKCGDSSSVQTGECDPEKKSCLPLTGVECKKKKVVAEENDILVKIGEKCTEATVAKDCSADPMFSPVPPTVQCIKSKCTQLYAVGDKCEKDANCFGDDIKCKDSVCTGLAKGKKCTGSNECEFGLYCKNAKCATQLAEGKTCADGSECETSALCGTGMYCAKSKCAEIPGKIEASCSSDSDCKGWVLGDETLKCVGNPFNSCDKSCGDISQGFISEFGAKFGMMGIVCTDSGNAVAECLRNNKCASDGGYADPLDANACQTQHCKVEILKAQSCLCAGFEDSSAATNAFIVPEGTHCGFVWEWWSILLVVLAALTCCGGITYGVLAFRKKRAAYTPV